MPSLLEPQFPQLLHRPFRRRGIAIALTRPPLAGLVRHGLERSDNRLVLADVIAVIGKHDVLSLHQISDECPRYAHRIH